MFQDWNDTMFTWHHQVRPPLFIVAMRAWRLQYEHECLWKELRVAAAVAFLGSEGWYDRYDEPLGILSPLKLDGEKLPPNRREKPGQAGEKHHFGQRKCVPPELVALGFFNALPWIFVPEVLAWPFARVNRWSVAEGGRAVAIFCGWNLKYLS